MTTIISSIIYIIIFFVTWIFVVSFLQKVFQILIKYTFNYDFVRDYAPTNRGCLKALIVLSYVTISFPIVYHSLGMVFNYHPPFEKEEKTSLNLKKSIEVAIENIENILPNYQKLPKEEIRTDSSLALLKQLKKEEREYRNALNNIKTAIDKAKIEARNSKAKLDSLKTLELDELKKVEKVIFKSINEKSQKDFWTDNFLGFIIGVLSSLTATWLLASSKKNSN